MSPSSRILDRLAYPPREDSRGSRAIPFGSTQYTSAVSALSVGLVGKSYTLNIQRRAVLTVRGSTDMDIPHSQRSIGGHCSIMYRGTASSDGDRRLGRRLTNGAPSQGGWILGWVRIASCFLNFYRSCSRSPFFIGLSNFRGPVFNFSFLHLSDFSAEPATSSGFHPERGNEDRGVGKGGSTSHTPRFSECVFCG